MAKWKGLFEWSMAYQQGGRDNDVKEISEERKKWLEEAFANYMQDWAGRMKVIKDQLEQHSFGERPSAADATPAPEMPRYYELLEEL